MTTHEDEMAAFHAMESGKYDAAVRILNGLAQRNSHYALLSLGWIYETGVSGKIDKEAAKGYYQQALAHGSTPAYFELGRLHASEGDEIIARQVFSDGAARGDIPSMARLGKMMVEGTGGDIDLREGTAWLEKAAARGHIHARRTLLAISERNAKSLTQRLSIKRQIVALAKEGAQEMLKNPDSFKLK